VTRSGARARGIAQFMPRTASERGLLDPYDPVQALPKVGEFLRQLLQEFGNLGLAAAAYNAGPRRVRDWLEGRGGLLRKRSAMSRSSPATRLKNGRRLESRSSGQAALFAYDLRTMTAMMREAPSLYLSRLTRQIEKSATSPWGVQVSAGFSRERALASLLRHREAHRESRMGLTRSSSDNAAFARTHPF